MFRVIVLNKDLRHLSYLGRPTITSILYSCLGTSVIVSKILIFTTIKCPLFHAIVPHIETPNRISTRCRANGNFIVCWIQDIPLGIE